jgi:hypothetical protein
MLLGLPTLVRVTKKTIFYRVLIPSPEQPGLAGKHVQIIVSILNPVLIREV